MAGRILVVDDEAGLREMLRVLLRRAGYDVEVADGQRRATELLAGSTYDVVVTDLSMPDGSGMGVLAQSKRANETTQVIMITAYATTAQAVQAMREGATTTFRNRSRTTSSSRSSRRQARSVRSSSRTARCESA